jgi:hypothetical protein
LAKEAYAMRKLLVLLGVGIGAALVLRRFGGRLQSACEEMMAGMEEHGPPAKIIGGIREIRDQNQRIISLLEQQLPDDGTKPQAALERTEEPSEG